MKHAAVDSFVELYNVQPLRVRKQADHNFSVIKDYPQHPLLRLVKAGEFVSMRVGSRHRALAVEDGESVIWFWIGTHSQYSALFH